MAFSGTACGGRFIAHGTDRPSLATNPASGGQVSDKAEKHRQNLTKALCSVRSKQAETAIGVESLEAGRAMEDIRHRHPGQDRVSSTIRPQEGPDVRGLSDRQAVLSHSPIKK